LGGALINELDSSGQKQAGYVYYPSGRELASQNNNLVTWKHTSPVHTTRMELLSSGWIDRVELDPTGADLSLSAPPEPNGGTESGDINGLNIGALMDSMYAALNNPASGCVVDGFETGCNEAVGHLNRGTGGDTAFTRSGATTGKELSEAVMLGMGPAVFAPAGRSAIILNVSGIEGTPGHQRLEWQWVTYGGQSAFVPVPTAYSGTAGTQASIVVFNQTPITRLTTSAHGAMAKSMTTLLGKSNKLPDCVKKFLSQFYKFDQVVEAITYSNDGIPFYVPIDARGFTLGDHIYFKEGAFDPSNGVSDGEMILLAHEVSHVIQYRESGKLKMSLDYLWQSGLMGAAGLYLGGPLMGPVVGEHLSYYGNEYEQDADSTEDVVATHIRVMGNPCK